MTKQDAVNHLSNGHAWWTVAYAKEICEALDIELPKRLIDTFRSQHEANPTNHYKGLFLNSDTKFPVSGVGSLSLSDYIAKKILGTMPSSDYIGRGFGAQANSEALTKHFGF